MDTWPEVDKRGVETFEFIRSQINYTEQELREKPILVFLDIVERANRKVAQENRAQSGRAQKPT